MPPTSYPLPAARQRRKNLSGPARNMAMHLGKIPERGQDPDSSRTARRLDHGQRRRQAAPPAAQAGGAEDRPSPGTMHSRRTRPRWTTDRPPPRTTGTQAPPAPATIDSSTEDTTPGPGSRTAPRPATAPQSQDSGRPAPTPDDIPHAAQDARQRPTLDRWTGGIWL